MDNINKKIGILTFHKGYNYGGFLQAYSVQKFLESIGIESEIIDYVNKKSFLKELMVLFWPKRILSFLDAIKKILYFNKMFKMFKISKKHFSKKSINKSGYSAIYFGSDEIWNFGDGFCGYDGIFFGVGLKNIELNSFCASFGDTDFSKHKIPGEAIESLKNFRKISVRDVNSKNFIKNTLKRDAPNFLDPLFLNDMNLIKSGRCPYKDFILIYAPRVENKHLAQIINFAREQNKKIISVGYYLPWADINKPSLSIEDFIQYFKNSEHVITTMFHGTILSIKFQKSFCSIIVPGKENKIKSMLSSLELESRQCNNNIRELLSSTVDYKKVLKKIDDNRKSMELFILK